MGRQAGRHEGVVAHVFPDGTYGSGWSSGGATVTTGHDGTPFDHSELYSRPDEEISGWRAVCYDLDRTGIVECWRGPLWTRVATPAEQDLDAHRIYLGDRFLDQESEDLIMVDWEIHTGPADELHLVGIAHDQVDDAQRKLTGAVRTARNAGASWTDIGRAVGISRQSAHERWAKTTDQATR